MSLKGTDRTLAFALFLFLLSIYLLTYSGSFHSSDGQAMFSVAESMVRRGEYDINQIRWMGLQQGTFGTDGELYCRKGLASSLVALPLVWLGMVVPFWGVVQTAMLLNVIVTALTGVLVLLYVRRLGYASSTAVATALVLGLGTLAWPYAKYFFSEPLTGLCLLAAAYGLLHLTSTQVRWPNLWPAAFSGFWLGLAIAARFANAVLIPLYLGALVFHIWRRDELIDWSAIRAKPSRLLSTSWREVCTFALPILLWGAIIVAYNYLRFGNPLTTGYLPEESFSAPWLTGILGLLASPGRGIIFFCPVLVACIPAVPSFFRRHRLEAMLLLLVSISYLLLYGKWFMWHGGFAWGPRFLVPILPLLTITLSPLIESLKGRWLAAFCALLGLSVAVQVLGLSVHFIHQQEALLDTGLPLFDPTTFFTPRYSQIWGALAFLTPDKLDFAWLRSFPPEVRVDWLALTVNVALVILSGWGLILGLRRRDMSQRRVWTLLVILLLLIAGGTAVSLAQYKNDGHADYVSMLEHLEAGSLPSDAIIQNSPPETAILQNHYKGRLPSYGLFEGEQPLSADTLALLDRLAEVHERFWLIPDGLAPESSSLDRWFTERGYSARHQTFGHERLSLYTTP